MTRNKLLVALLVAAAPTLLAWAIACYGVDVPVWDEWFMWANLAPALDSGREAVIRIFAQHNEQRIAATRILELLFHHQGLHDRTSLMWLNMAMAGGIFLFAALLYDDSRETLRASMAANGAHRTAPPVAAWPFAALSLLAFSPMQWETFTIGFNNQLLFPPLCILAATFSIQKRSIGPGRLIVISALGFLSSFSFSAGLLFWPALFPLVLLSKNKAGRRTPHTLTFCVLGACAWGAYFAAYVKPHHHPPLTDILLHPLSFAGYFLAWIGSPLWAVRPLPQGAVVVGAVGIFLICVAGGRLLLCKDRRASALPWLPPLLFALMCAAVTAAGRAGFGIGQAQESRYTTFSSLFWIPLAAWTALALAGTSPLCKERLVRLPLLFFLTLWSLSAVLSIAVMHNRAPQMLAARNQLFSFVQPQRLQRLFPDVNWLEKRLPELVSRRISVYADTPVFASLLKTSIPAGELVSKQPTPSTLSQTGGVLITGQLATTSEGIVLERNGMTALFIPTKEMPMNDDGFRLFIPGPFFLNPQEGDARSALPMNIWSLRRGVIAPVQNGTVQPPNLAVQPEFTVQEHFLLQK